MNFNQALKVGQAGESVIAQWWRSIDYSVLPVYEKIIDNGKGPRLFPRGGLNIPDLIAPDLFVFKDTQALWVEAKTKSAFSEHRISGRELVTGIDLHHYGHYQKVEEVTPWPVWLLFLHLGGVAIGGNGPTPAGLFGGKLSELSQCEHHRHKGWGKGGMVYWSIDSLNVLATIDDLRNMYEPELAMVAD